MVHGKKERKKEKEEEEENNNNNNNNHNTAQIQHCPISTTFHMWVDYDVPNRFLTSKNFYRSPFSKWPPQYCTNSTSDNVGFVRYCGGHFENGDR
jgi:hypothetical protein